MNWVLILIVGYNSQQVGPFASHGDCEKAFAIVQSQDKGWINQHFCVPKPKTGASVDSPYEFPEEFD